MYFPVLSAASRPVPLHTAVADRRAVRPQPTTDTQHFLDRYFITFFAFPVHLVCLRLSYSLPSTSIQYLLTSTFCFTSTEARWLIRDGDRGEGDERVKARPRIPPEKDRRDRGPPPEQWIFSDSGTPLFDVA